MNIAEAKKFSSQMIQEIEKALMPYKGKPNYCKLFYVAMKIMESWCNKDCVHPDEIKKQTGRRSDIVDVVIKALKNANMYDEIEKFSKFYEDNCSKITADILRMDENFEDVQLNLTDEEIEDLKRILGDYYLLCLNEGRQRKFEQLTQKGRVTKSDYLFVFDEYGSVSNIL